MSAVKVSRFKAVQISIYIFNAIQATKIELHYIMMDVSKCKSKISEHWCSFVSYIKKSLPLIGENMLVYLSANIRVFRERRSRKSVIFEDQTIV